MSHWSFEVLLPLSIFAMMFSIGLTLTIGDFRQIVSERRSLVIGLTMQLLLMPLVGLVLALVFELPSRLGAGLVLLAACPGGLLSNLLVFFAGGSTALSVCLTGSATIFTLVTVPVWVSIYAEFIDASPSSVDLPLASTAAELGLLTILPLTVGIVSHGRLKHSARISNGISKLSLGVIVLTMMLDFQERSLPVESFATSVEPALWLAGAAAVVGILVPRILFVSGAETATIAVELVAKNGLLAIAIARSSLGLESTMPAIAFAMFQAPIALVILVSWRHFTRLQRI